MRKLTGKNVRVAQQLFQQYDVDNSGTIDVDELHAVLKDLLDLRLNESQWRTFVSDELRKRDKDENGPFQQTSNRGCKLFDMQSCPSCWRVFFFCSAGVLDFDEFLKLYKSCLSNARVRGKYADKMTVKYKQGKAVLTVMTPSISAAGALSFSTLNCAASWLTVDVPGVITETEERLDDQSEGSGDWNSEQQVLQPTFGSGTVASTPTRSETLRKSTGSARRSGTITASHNSQKTFQ